jgi:uncharacterized protein (TIGR00725 family)
VAVIGSREPSADQDRAARIVGRELATAGATVVTGGGQGVMAAASRGAHEAGGMVVGILPGIERSAANPWVKVAIPTGMGELRNGLVVRCADAVVAVGGAYGTLSEIALALGANLPVVGYDTWGIEGIEVVESPEEAAARALAKA